MSFSVAVVRPSVRDSVRPFVRTNSCTSIFLIPLCWECKRNSAIHRLYPTPHRPPSIFLIGNIFVPHLLLENDKLEIGDTFCYLSVVFNHSGSTLKTVKALSEQALITCNC